MDTATRQAFDTLWENCTPEQQQLREAWLPSRENPQPAYEAELLRRFENGLPLTVADKKRARRLLKAI